MKAISITNKGSRPTNQDAFHQGEQFLTKKTVLFM